MDAFDFTGITADSRNKTLGSIQKAAGGGKLHGPFRRNP
jgi:hypothetical protein